jgi:hypothetical protein
MNIIIIKITIIIRAFRQTVYNKDATDLNSSSKHTHTHTYIFSKFENVTEGRIWQTIFLDKSTTEILP